MRWEYIENNYWLILVMPRESLEQELPLMAYRIELSEYATDDCPMYDCYLVINNIDCEIAIAQHIDTLPELQRAAEEHLRKFADFLQAGAQGVSAK